MNKNLLILGAGQYGAVAKEIAESMDYYDKIDFLDDNFGDKVTCCGTAIIGKLENCTKLVGDYSYAAVAIGNPRIRRKWIHRLEECDYNVPDIVSPRAYISPSAQLYKGCIVEPLAGINANVVVGTGSLISMGAIINHDSIVMDFCHIDCGAILMSGAVVRSGIKVEAGKVIKMPENKPQKIVIGFSRYEK